MANSLLHIIPIAICSIFLSFLLLIATPYYTPDNTQESVWKWDKNTRYKVQIIPGQTSPFSPPSTLILQRSTPGASEVLLGITSRVNRAYAKRWGFDYVNVVGNENEAQLLNVLLDAATKATAASVGAVSTVGTTSINENTTTSPTSNAMNDENLPKIAYDTVLLMNSGTIVVQLDYDIRKILGYENDASILMAWGAAQDYSSVWSDVKIFNLKHDNILDLTDAWMYQLDSDPNDMNMNRNYNNNNNNNNNNNMNTNGNTINNGDEEVDPSTLGLFQVLQNDNTGIFNGKDISNINNNNNNNGSSIISIDRSLIDGLKGTYIKEELVGYVQQSDLPSVVPVIQGIADNVCYRYYPQCEII